jgi:N4-gp56 family major capsid protein
MGMNNFVDDTTNRAQKYLETVWREKVTNLFWTKFMDFPMPGQAGFAESQFIIDQQTGLVTGYKSKDNAAIYVMRDLTKGQGDKVTFSHVKSLRGEGIKGSDGTTLKNNVEDMSASAFYLELEEYAHAVGDKSPLGRKRTMFDIVQIMGEQLMSWGGVKTDNLIWDALYSGTPSAILYPGTVSATTGLTDDPSHKITMKDLRKAKVIAKTEKIGSRFIIEPLIINGKDHYIVVMPEDSMLDLKNLDTEYQAALLHAATKGDANPIFAGAEAVTVDGLILYSHDRAKKVTNWGSASNLPGSRIKLFGKKAICYAMGPAPTMVADDEDFGRAKELAFMMYSAFKRPTFDSIDVGSLEIRVSRTQVSDA